MIEEKSLVYLLLRIILGSIFIYHGISKLGAGYNSWIDYMNSKQISSLWAIAAIIAEIFIGVKILFGLYTRISALGGLAFMIAALYIAHSNDPIFGEKGISYQILIMLLCIGLALTGGGKYVVIKD